jgi:hypothetical protein
VSVMELNVTEDWLVGAFSVVRLRKASVFTTFSFVSVVELNVTEDWLFGALSIVRFRRASVFTSFPFSPLVVHAECSSTPLPIDKVDNSSGRNGFRN